MDEPSSPLPPPRWRKRMDPQLAVPALAALVAGLAYYAALRGEAPVWSIDPSAGTFPSLAHGFATTLLLLAVTGPARIRCAALTIGTNLVLTATLECTLGIFDPNDLAALGVGTLAAITYAWIGSQRARPRRIADAAGRRSRFAVPLLLAASTTMTMATQPYDDDERDRPYSSAREPVYLSYAQLREAVRVSEPRPLEDVGRVYLYENYLFLNARNEGVHVIDNTDPANPRPISFIEIPGNTELAIRDAVLFADSYVDLVAIELGGFGAGPMEVSRQTDIFPWDPYQSVPEGTWFNRLPDQDLGVVIDVEGDNDR